jgi:DNA-binding transcriptional regulator YiaG
MMFMQELKTWRGKLRQKEAAEKLGVPLSTFRKWEQGKKTPRVFALAELRRMIGVSK